MVLCGEVLKTRKSHLRLYFICFTISFLIFCRRLDVNGFNFRLPETASQHKTLHTYEERPANYYDEYNLHGKKQCFQLSWNISKDKLQLADLATNLCQRFVTIIKYVGRTGNDLFQIAAMFGIAYRYDLIPVVPADFPLLKYIDLPNVVNTTKFKIENNINCLALKPGMYVNFEKKLNLASNFTMYGPFQSWRYFGNENVTIRNILRLNSDRVRKVEIYLKKVNPHRYIQVCIHVRRGDFTNDREVKMGFSVASKTFIEKAKRIFVQKFSQVLFILVTDDKLWCKQNILNVTISPFVDPGDDLALMASCDHAIITSGTFGWWGAWLSGGQCIYFKGFPRPKSRLDKVFIRYDYYPPTWTGLY